MAYISHRQQQGIVNKKGERTSDVRNAEINRELQILKRMFNLAVKDGRLGMRPHIPMLRGTASGRVLRGGAVRGRTSASAPGAQLVVTFAYITGWRIASEVLPLEWRNVDFTSGEVRLDVGSTKNGEGRMFVMTAGLRTLLEAQRDRATTVEAQGPHLPLRVLPDGCQGPRRAEGAEAHQGLHEGVDGRVSAAGCPGRIPHDFRRTAVRNMVRAGIPRSVAMRMVGHKTEAIYRRYRIVDEQDLRDAAVRLDGVAPPKAQQA